MKGRTTGYSSDSEQNMKEDLSVLRKPIYTALNGFLEAKRAYDNGTEEIRRLLSRECDIMYECKICKNIFRSLTNFISHKRVYCRTTFNNLSQFNSHNNGFIDQDISTIIQAEQDFVKKSLSKDNKSSENSGKDLSSIIERLVKREQTNRLLKLTDFYEQVNKKLTQEEILQKKHILQLDKVPNSDVAVYQTVKNNEADNIKKEVAEVHDLLLKENTVLGPDGKILEIPATSKTFSSLALNTFSEEEVTCDICHLKFMTEKTLKLHIQSKHISSTFVYQCPSCSQAFMQPGAVIRHLSTDHKKSIRRIRLMRESIFKKRVRLDEVHVKGPSRELARLQIDKEKSSNDNYSWMDSVQRQYDAPTCNYCGKTFERKAVLTTHLNNCMMKIKLEKRELSNNCKGEENKTVNIEQNDCEMVSDDSRKSNFSINLEMEDKIPSIDLTKDDIPKGRRKKPPKIEIKKNNFSQESFNNLLLDFNKEKLSLKTVSLDNLEKKENSENHQANKSEQPLKVASNKDLCFFCKICEKKFDALSNLRRHISMFHFRRRKFGCKLCDYRAFRKYDVINHLNSAHALSGDREFVLEFIVIREEKDMRTEDVDDDVIITESTNLNTEQNTSQAIDRRGRRSKVTKDGKPQTVFTRSSSNLSLSSNEDSLCTTISKRPIRNRVKPVNKDFVYDLSNLLKKDMILADRDYSPTLSQQKPQKRRSTTLMTDENSRDDPHLLFPNIDNDIKPPKILVKGYASAMAQLAVSSFNACFSKPPELQSESNVIPSRIVIPPRSGDINSEMKSEKKSLGEKITKTQLRRVSEDGIMRSLIKRRKVDNSSPLSDIVVDRITRPNELDVNGGKRQNFDNNEDNISQSKENIKIKIKCPTEKEFQEYLIANKLTEPVKKIDISSLSDSSSQESVAPTTKRVSLVQRLVDNRQKKLQESLLRSALEN